MKEYIGHELQIYGVQEMRLCGGKGDGMRLLNVRNSKGLEFYISLDRCGDISRISLGGVNLTYISPCGYVAPTYYDAEGSGFLKSFTAGFFTTCGLTAVGSPCEDAGEKLPLHGNISHIPCDNVSHYIEDGNIHIIITVHDAALFSHNLLLKREYICPINENVIYVKDSVTNQGSKEVPFEILYHCNMGYPLLSENASLNIPSTEVTPRDEKAANDIKNYLKMEIPQKNYEERCYYHKMSGKPTVSIYNPDVNKSVKISYDTAQLKCFTQWKMMGEKEYVLGLEPGNCTPDGRDVMRQKGMLEFISPEETRIFDLKFEFSEEN